MNSNFTHQEFKNFILKVINFLSILPVLPAGQWLVVNFLLTVYSNLFSLPAISKSAISEFFNVNITELKLKPVFTMHAYVLVKKQVNN